MYWVLAFTPPIIGVGIVFLILSRKWDVVSGKKDHLGVLQMSMLNQVRIFLPWLPGRPGYWDLKFSAIRHAFAFIVVATALYFVDGFLESAILVVNLLYTTTLWVRYRARKNETNSEVCRRLSERSQVIAKMLARDSLPVAVFGTILCALSYVLLFFKPL